MNIAGLLLAGGEGRRMDGQDKGLVALCGQPLVAFVVQRLRPQVGRLYISANRNLAKYRQYADDVCEDDPAWQGMGPLAALATAHAYLPASTDMVQLAACDMPLLPFDLVTRLAAVANGGVVLPVSEEGPQPACLLLPRHMLATVSPYLGAGGRSIRGWLARMPVTQCAFPAEGFANANDAQALRQLARHPALCMGHAGDRA